MKKSVELDLGCGTAKVPEAIGVDNVALSEVDVVHDLLSFPYPFSDSIAETIHLRHVIEHFRLEDIQQILSEVYRILQPGGTVDIRIPHVFSIAAWVDVTHKSYFTFDSVEFWNVTGPKVYYLETTNIWQVVSVKSRVTIFNWKRYRMRQLDNLLSRQIARHLNWLLKSRYLQGSADLLVKLLPLFFVEIQWQLKKE